jgi:hypothetical protein
LDDGVSENRLLRSRAIEINRERVCDVTIASLIRAAGDPDSGLSFVGLRNSWCVDHCGDEVVVNLECVFAGASGCENGIVRDGAIDVSDQGGERSVKLRWDWGVVRVAEIRPEAECTRDRERNAFARRQTCECGKEAGLVVSVCTTKGWWAV